jgi:hypothetical protein
MNHFGHLHFSSFHGPEESRSTSQKSIRRVHTITTARDFDGQSVAVKSRLMREKTVQLQLSLLNIREEADLIRARQEQLKRPPGSQSAT